MFRPEGWDKEAIKREATQRYDLLALLEKQKEVPNFNALPILLDALMDATADAMLKALREEGKRGGRGENNKGNFAEYGTIVFIPDDE